MLLSGSGRQLRPAEPPGDADVDAEDEDSVSFFYSGIFSGMGFWQLPCSNGILNISFTAGSCWQFFSPIKNVVFLLGILLPAEKLV